MTRRVRLEVVSALLVLPLAVALTVVSLVAPARSDAVDDRTTVPPTTGIKVSLEGGDPVSSYGLADELSRRGFEVVAVGARRNSLGSRTTVVYYERALRGDAERLRDLLGVGTIRREQAFSPPTDLKVFIGKDLQST